MGCVPSKNSNFKVSANKRVHPDSNQAKLNSIRANILDSIKRKDIILFEKTMVNNHFEVTEFLGTQDEKKTVLHYLAEFNFYDGMSLALEYLTHQNQTPTQKALNLQDSNGNTPAITCCIFDSAETLEVLMKSGLLNMNLKNTMGQTAQMIACEHDSPCLNLLISTRDTTRSIIVGSQQSHFGRTNNGEGSPKLPPPSIKDEVAPANNSNNNSIMSNPKGFRSIHSIKKESKLSPDTRLHPVLMDLMAKNKTFIDEEFPHDDESVAAEDFRDQYRRFGPVKWIRVSELFGTEVKSFSIFEGIDFNDVSESPLAGCDLYSALTIMTEFPQRLLKMFTVKDTNKHGAYSIKLMVSGVPVEILLDDYFPCLKDNQPLFSKPPTNEIWYLLAEKAFAKLYGGYNELRYIHINDALEMMTGMPTAQYSLKEFNKDDLWNQLVDFDKKNYIICAGNTQKEDNEKDRSNRIFSVARIYETEQYKILKMRNHFRDFVWKGDFSEGSKLLTKDLKEEIGHYAGEENCFYMEINEFIKHFEFLTVCYYNDNWIRNGEEVTTAPNKAAFFEIEVDREMEVIISVHQKLPRFVDEDDYDISPVEILVAEELQEEGSLKKVAKGESDAFMGKTTVYASNKIKTKLSEGRYFVRTKIRWVDEIPHDFVFNVFSTNPLSLNRAAPKDSANFLERVYLDAGLRSNDRYQFQNFCEFGSSWCGPHLWLYGINKGTKTWNLEINFNKLENLQLCKKYRTSENTILMVIPPKGQAVAFAKRINTHKVELNWGFNQNWV